MHFDSNNIDTIPGLLLTVMLTAFSVLLNVPEVVKDLDMVLLPIVHTFQILAAATAVLVGVATLSPNFKNWLKSKLRIKN